MISVSKSLKPGYSFIELMFGILIMAVLAGFVVPKMLSLLGKSKRRSTENTLKIVKTAIQEYKEDVKAYPQSLKDLVVKPEGANGWQGPYVGNEDSANPEVPQDAFGGELVYKLKERGAKPRFELYSLGDQDKEEDRIDA